MGSSGGGLGGIVGGIGNALGGVFGNTGGGEGSAGFYAGAMPGEPQRPDLLTAFTNPTGAGGAQALGVGYTKQYAQPVSQNNTSLDYQTSLANAAPGNTPWEQMMHQTVANQQATGRSNLAQQNASNLAQAKSQLAQQKGLSSGANERLAMNAQRANQASQQGLANQGNLANLNVGTKAQEMQDQMRQQNIGNQLNQAKFQQGQQNYAANVANSNVDTALNQLAAQNQGNLSAYQSQMKDWANAGQANAISAANQRGKK